MRGYVRGGGCAGVGAREQVSVRRDETREKEERERRRGGGKGRTLPAPPLALAL